MEQLLSSFEQEPKIKIKSKKVNFFIRIWTIVKLHNFLFSPKKSFLEVKMSNANENHLLGRPKNFIDIKKKFMNKS